MRNRDYVLWFVGGTVSSFGSVVSAAAYPMLVLFVTGSAAQAGIVAAAESLGMLFTLLIGRVTSGITFLAYSLTWLGPAGAGVLAAVVGAPAAGLIVAGVLASLALVSHFVKALHLLDEEP